jgi:hypothetical protein
MEFDRAWQGSLSDETGLPFNGVQNYIVCKLLPVIRIKKEMRRLAGISYQREMDSELNEIYKKGLKCFL